MWDEWKRTTRFIHSARIALTREHRLWSSLEIADEKTAKLRTQLGTAEYEIGLAQHRNALSDEDILCSMALLHSYAIAESAAAAKLGKDTEDIGQIETWGQRILERVSREWDDVMDGKAGIVEVTVYRNAIAHGARVFEERHVNRMKNVPHSPAWKQGDPITVTYDLLKTFRARLKSLVRQGDVNPLTFEQLAARGDL